MTSRLTPCLLTVFSVACAHAPKKPTQKTEGMLLDSQEQKLSDSAFLDRTKGAQFILIGESHDNPCDHRQQARLIEVLGLKQRIGVVGFEMLALDQQPVIDLINRGQVGTNEAGGALDWKRRWGVPFELYEPIFRAAAAQKLKIAALNAPEGIVKKVRAGGLEQLDSTERSGITPTIVPPPEAQETMLREAMEAHGHSNMPPEATKAMWEQFVRVQSFWDSQMAYSALQESDRRKAPIAIVAGAGHVDHGWGIAHRLRHFAPAAKIVSIVPLRPGEPFDSTRGDVFYVCPEVQKEPVATTTR